MKKITKRIKRGGTLPAAPSFNPAELQAAERSVQIAEAKLKKSQNTRRRLNNRNTPFAPYNSRNAARKGMNYVIKSNKKYLNNQMARVATIKRKTAKPKQTRINHNKLNSSLRRIRSGENRLNKASKTAQQATRANELKQTREALVHYKNAVKEIDGLLTSRNIPRTVTKEQLQGVKDRYTKRISELQINQNINNAINSINNLSVNFSTMGF